MAQASEIERKITDSSLFIAIDFGTTYSGFAFAIGRNSTEIIVQPDSEGKKIATRLLLNADGSLKAFGNAAWELYRDLDEEDASRYYLFDRFKMNLLRDAEVSGDKPIKASNCEKTFPAKVVFGRSLQYFYETAKKRLVAAMIGGDPEKEWPKLEKEVTWIITVPAIWGDRAKQFMTEAAIEAGMATEATRHKVLIELEPEGAALSCRDDLQLISRKLGYPPKLRYMVVDCGGGTIDVTVHDLEKDTRKITELHQATGGDWGGTAIDGNIRQFIERLIGQRVASQLSKDDWLEFTRISIEEAKRSGQSSFGKVNVALPLAFFQTITSKGCDLNAAVKAFKGVTFRSSHGTLRFDAEVFQEFFTEAIDNIVSHVRNLLSKIKRIDCILVVGGFAESPFLFDRLCSEFDTPHRTVIRPTNASLSILKGAVMYGQNPNTIETRISKYSYGIRTNRPFDPKKDPKEKKIMIQGQAYCEHVFDPIVEAGKPVKIGNLFEKGYVPNKPSQTCMTLAIYSAEETVPYTTGLEPLATLEVPMPNVEKGLRRRVIVQMDFSRTQLHFSAKDTDGGEAVETKVTFNHL